MSEAKRRAISQKGARALHEQGLASKFTTETARAALDVRYGRTEKDTTDDPTPRT